MGRIVYAMAVPPSSRVLNYHTDPGTMAFPAWRFQVELRPA